MNRSLKHAKRHVFAIDGKIFVSPYSYPPCFAQDKLAQRDPDPSATRVTRFSDNCYPTLAWVPTSPRYDSKLLTVLKNYPRDFGVRQVLQ